MERDHVFRMPHLAGRVKRYHTWPTLHTQTVGEHTWQVLRLYCQMFKYPTGVIAEYIIWHDAGELVTGDPPFPLKADNPKLKVVYDELEFSAITGMGGVSGWLSENEKLRVKLCDLLEMYEFGSIEFRMGNKFAEPIIRDTLAAAHRIAAKLPREDFDGFLKYINLNRYWHGMEE